MMAARKKKTEDGDEVASGIIIQINQDWRMVWDGLQFICQRRQVRGAKSKNKGKVNWVSEAYICELDSACIWLAKKQIYAIPGVFGIEGIDKLGAALDRIRAETRTAVKAGLVALEREYDTKLAAAIACHVKQERPRKERLN